MHLNMKWFQTTIHDDDDDDYDVYWRFMNKFVSIRRWLTSLGWIWCMCSFQFDSIGLNGANICVDSLSSELCICFPFSIFLSRFWLFRYDKNQIYVFFSSTVGYARAQGDLLITEVCINDPIFRWNSFSCLCIQMIPLNALLSTMTMQFLVLAVTFGRKVILVFNGHKW